MIKFIGMKWNLVFILTFFLCFGFLTIGIMLIFAHGRTGELYGNFIYGNLFYIVIGGLAWILINAFVSRGITRYRTIVRFFLGFLVLSTLMYFTTRSFTLLGLFVGGPDFGPDIYITVVYIVSFAGASFISNYKYK